MGAGGTTDATVSKQAVNVVAIVAVLAIVVVAMVVQALLWGDFDTGVGFWLAVAAIYVLGIVAHEATHGVGYRAFGGLRSDQVGFGFMWKALMPFAHAKAPMQAAAYRRAVLLPGLVTGVLPMAAGLATGFAPLTLAGAALLGAAGGDWAVVYAIRKVPGDRLVRDHPADVGAEVLPAGSA